MPSFNDVMVVLLLVIGAIGGIYYWRYRYYRTGNLLRTHLASFFGIDPKDFKIVSRAFATVELPNIERAMQQYIESHGSKSETIGYSSTFGGMHNDMRSMISEETYSATQVGPVQYREVDIGVDETLLCVEGGIHLIRSEPRLAAHVRFDMMKGVTEIEAVSVEAQTAERFLEEIRTAMARQSVYKGKVISLECDRVQRSGTSCFQVKFHRPPEIKREQIILPERVLNLIERNTLGFYRNAEALKRSGLSTKRGMLLYGKPGTGKTFTAKWLAHAQPDLTVLLLSGEQLYLIKECCRLARMLAPSLVIMEDVDLVATHRDVNMDPSSHITLHQILNEIDGMPNNTDVMFLMTTNRADVLEPALAGRPGRIDQAIEYPLPDSDCRRRLFDLYSQNIDLQVESVDEYVHRTEGASPAFIQELLRKSALIATERLSIVPDRIPVNDEDLQTALRELLFDGGSLTRELLGFSAEASDALRVKLGAE